MDKIHDVITLGAGAAGLMCAIEAAKRGRSVLVIEKNESIAKKIRISGGGRCNFTNMNVYADNYISSNPHFVKSALSRYTPDDFSALLNKYKVRYHEKKLGQLFCDNSSSDVINVLRKECDKYNVGIIVKTDISKVTKDDLFILGNGKNTFMSHSLVVATGGLSVPAIGVSDLGYKIAGQFGIRINPVKPGLTPLLYAGKDLKLFGSLSGISLDITVKYKKLSFRENMLFTHKGVSGPAILQISSYWEPPAPLHIDLFPETDIYAVMSKEPDRKKHLKNLLSEYLPKRFVEVLCSYYISDSQLFKYPDKEMRKISDSLHDWTISPEKSDGYSKAEVTVGGVDTNELSSKTMEAKKVPGLYFIGEVVDVTGHLGGFNFQWAWASGYSAGQYA